MKILLLLLIGLVALGRGACTFEGSHPLTSCEACDVWCADSTLNELECGCTQSMCSEGTIIPMFERIVNPQTLEVEQVLCIAHNGTTGFPVLPGCICARTDNTTVFSGMDDAVCEFLTGDPACDDCDGDGIQCMTNPPTTAQPTVQPTDAPTSAPTSAPTDAPTGAPTPPTEAPTGAPTEEPPVCKYIGEHPMGSCRGCAQWCAIEPLIRPACACNQSVCENGAAAALEYLPAIDICEGYGRCKCQLGMFMDGSGVLCPIDTCEGCGTNVTTCTIINQASCLSNENCDDGNPCTEDICDVEAGCTCTNPPSPEGVACDDGDRCTGDDVCDGFGQCQGVPPGNCTASPTTSPTPGPTAATTGTPTTAEPTTAEPTTTAPPPTTEEPCIELGEECQRHPQHHINNQHPGSDNNGNHEHCCDNLVCLFEPRPRPGGGRRKKTCQLLASTTTTAPATTTAEETTTTTMTTTVNPTPAPPTKAPTVCAYDDHLHPLDSCQNCQIWCMMGHPACACDGTTCGDQAATLSSPGVCTLNGEITCACGRGNNFRGFTAPPGNTCTGTCSRSCPQNAVVCGHPPPTTAAPTTAAPTLPPTKAPTTAAPTNSPTTGSPTGSPTASPTMPPSTGSPTGSPTASPTSSPTTEAPTSAPTTVAPTPAPTTLAPTPAPTRECENHSECDDDNTCTQNICNPRGQCEFPPEPCGTRCDDGLFCTGRDFCCNGECSIHGGNPCQGCTLNAHCNDETDTCELPPTPAPPTGAPTELQTTEPPTPQPTHQCVAEGERCKLEKYWWWQGGHDNDRRRTLGGWRSQRCCAGTKCKRERGDDDDDDDRRAVAKHDDDDDDDDEHRYGKCVPSESPSCFSIDVTEGNCCPGYTGAECDEVDKCHGVDCLNGGECMPETGQCSCPADYSGPACSLRSCGHGGWYNRGRGRCVCRRGWRGERCDECDDPGRGKTYLCVPTHRDQNIYVLAKIHTNLVDQFISGERGAHPTLNYPAIYPNSVGYRQHTYDCACHRVESGGNSARALALPPATGKKQSRISAANVVLFDMVITDCVDNAAIAAMEMDELNELWDDCLNVEQKGGVSTWFTLGIVFIAVSGAALITIIVLAVLYARARARLANSIPVDRQYQQPLIGMPMGGYQSQTTAVARHPSVSQQEQADADWSLGGATKKIK